MFYRVSLAVLIALLYVQDATAQVQVSRVDRSFKSGTTVTIDGLRFGTKVVAAPKMWDDLTSPSFDRLSDDDIFPTRDGDHGHPQDSNAPQKDADYNESSTMAVLDNDHSRISGRYVYYLKDRKGSALLELGDVGGDLLVADWWIYSTDIRSGHASEIKIGRFWAGSSGQHGRVTILPTRLTWNNSVQLQYRYGSWVEDGAWNHYRLVIDSSGGLATDNGTIKLYWNNVLVAEGDNVGWTGDSSAPNYTWVEMIGAVDYNQTNPFVGPTYMSDIYLDNTQARVVLGDASTWSQVRHYELQVPSNWQPESIQVTGNLGSFTPLESVWLYVVDANGNVNENGFNVETDHGALPEGPGQPGRPVPPPTES